VRYEQPPDPRAAARYGAATPSATELLAGFKAQFRYFYGEGCGYFPIDEAIRDDESTTGILMLLPTEDKPDVPNMRVWCY
jgi:hypothetical protein